MPIQEDVIVNYIISDIHGAFNEFKQIPEKKQIFRETQELNYMYKIGGIGDGIFTTCNYINRWK